MVKFEIINSNKMKMVIALKGFSIRSLSRKIGMSHSYLSQIINKKRLPSAVIVKKICEGLDINIDDFFLITLVDELPKEVKS